MKYWFKNVADNIYIYPKSTPRNLILQTRTSDCNSAYYKKVYQTYETVNISKYEHIEVMDCQYDIKGFYPLNYEKVGEDAMIF